MYLCALLYIDRELATLLRVKPRALFKSLGGYLEKKKHRIVLSGVPYAFPNLGSVVVPFEVKTYLYLTLDILREEFVVHGPSGLATNASKHCWTYENLPCCHLRLP